MYFNDGKGNFTLYPRPLSPNGFNTAVALPIDFDHDGDTDLFVGSRSTSGSYGVPPPAFSVSEQWKGEFQDVAKLRAEDLKLYGMMTDATLADVIPGGDPEIIVTGEWASPAVFQWTDGKLTRVKSNLDEYPGWRYAYEAPTSTATAIRTWYSATAEKTSISPAARKHLLKYGFGILTKTVRWKKS
jgi:hypothetical protein